MISHFNQGKISRLPEGNLKEHLKMKVKQEFESFIQTLKNESIL